MFLFKLILISEQIADFENEESVRSHLEMHANYSATKQQIIAMCNKCSYIKQH